MNTKTLPRVARQVQKAPRSSTRGEMVCKHCHKTFVRERSFLEHKCTQMRRLEELNTPIGQAAWMYYQTWFVKMKKIPPRGDTFITSKFFRTFNNFATFVRKVNLPTPDKFIWLMVEKKFPPTMWMLDETYVLYLDFLEHKTPPMEQVRISINTLFAHADQYSVDVEDVFKVLHPSEIITMLRGRRLSPWLLLNSKKFKTLFIEKFSTEQQQILETLIQLESWSNRLTADLELTENIKRCVRELNL